MFKLNRKLPLEYFSLLKKLRTGIWFLGVPSWLFGIVDRSIASFADGYTSAIDLMQVLTASFLFVSWLLLKPNLRA